MRKIGYLRVSTDEQNLDRQIMALRPLCDELYIETLSALSKKRPLYERVKARLRSGDKLVVVDFDRAYRSTEDALREIKALKKRGIDFEITNFNFDIYTPEGKFILAILAARSEYERDLLSRRTKEGLAAARANGAVLGRPRKVSPAQAKKAKQRLKGRTISQEALAAEYNVSRSTLTRAIDRLTPNSG